jgi:hypothetical protein
VETQLTFRSELLASPEEAWQWATSLSGISSELTPIMKEHSNYKRPFRFAPHAT